MTQSIHPSMLRRSLDSLAHAYRRTFRARRPAISQNLFPSENGFWLTLIFVIATTFSLMLFWDVDVTLWKRAKLVPHGFVDQSFQFITLMGTSGWILVGTVLVGLYFSISPWKQLPRARRLRRINWYADANFAFFTIALSVIAANLIKNTIGRARPKILDTNGPYYFDFAAFDSTYASFPSGHSTTSGAIGMMLILLFPRFWLIWLVIAVLVGFSRVMVGAHYPSDVVAGLAFGAGFVIIAARWLALRGTMFSFGKGWIPNRKR